VTVHGVAREGFAEADRYERARPGYPPAAVSWLVELLLPYRVDCLWCEELHD
jgi:hypothetical protein